MVSLPSVYSMRRRGVETSAMRPSSVPIRPWVCPSALDGRQHLGLHLFDGRLLHHGRALERALAGLDPLQLVGQLTEGVVDVGRLEVGAVGTEGELARLAGAGGEQPAGGRHGDGHAESDPGDGSELRIHGLAADMSTGGFGSRAPGVTGRAGERRPSRCGTGWPGRRGGAPRPAGGGRACARPGRARRTGRRAGRGD